MAIDLSHKSVLFFDPSGDFVHMAEAVIGDFGAVKYFAPWDRGFPAVRDYVPGTGLDGIERVYDFFDALDETDLVVFPDVGNGGLQEYLRRQGMAVFGSGYAEQLERNRWFLKSICKKYKLECADAIPVTGLENLRQILAEMTDVYVKMSIFRGDDETFHHEDQADTTRRLNELALKMEPYSNHAEFVIEQPISVDNCVEIGADLCANVAGLYPRYNLWGYEAKDRAYAGHAGLLPQRLTSVLEKLEPILREFNYRGTLSTETKECKDGSYFLDFTARCANPPSPLMRFMVQNWGEIMWEAANGRIVEPEFAAPIGVQIILRSEYGAENPLRISVGRWDRTVLFGHCAYEGSDYSISPSEIAECAAACGMGSTLSQALEEAVNTAEGIKGREITWDEGALEELTESIETGDKLGISWE